MEPCKLSGGLRNPFAQKEDLHGPGLTGRGITLAQFLSFFLFSVPVSVCHSQLRPETGVAFTGWLSTPADQEGSNALPLWT